MDDMFMIKLCVLFSNSTELSTYNTENECKYNNYNKITTSCKIVETLFPKIVFALGNVPILKEK